MFYFKFSLKRYSIVIVDDIFCDCWRKII